MKKIGLLIDLGNKKQMDLTKSMIDIIKNSNDNLDVVVFYDSIKRMQKPLETSMLSFDNIWSFSGTLISMSLENLYRTVNIPFNIKHIYVPDYDETYNPITLLTIKENFEIICISNDTKMKIDRTIGTNKEIKLCNSINNIIGEI